MSGLDGRAWILSPLLAALCLLTGCGPKRGAGDAPPPLPAEVDAARLAERLAAAGAVPLRTLRVTATASVEGEGIDGRKVFRASVLAELPDRLRFRASREPVGELFQMVQTGDTLTIWLARERQIFRGPVDSLDDSAGLLKRLHPLWMLRGFFAGDHLARQAGHLAWKRLDRATLEGTGPSGFPDLPFGRFVVNEESLDLLRVFLYESDPDTGAGSLVVSVVYSGWTPQDGIRLPKAVTVSLPREKTRIELRSPDYIVNPPLPDASLVLQPPSGTEEYQLSQLVFRAEGMEDEAGER